MYFIVGTAANRSRWEPFTVCAPLIFGALAIAWTFSVYDRIINPRLRANVTALGLMMVSMLVLRTARYNLFADYETGRRFLWYLFYVPMTLLPLVSFYTALRLGKRDEDRLPKGVIWLPLPAAGLIAGVLTNDLHGLAFRFAPGFAGWEFNYVRGPLYYAVLVWVVALLALTFGIAVYKTTLPEGKKMAWVPVLGPAFYILWFLFEPFLGRTLHLPEVFCMMIAALWEGCIQVGLIPSNESYAELFGMSHAAAKLTDAAGNVVFAARAPAAVGENAVEHRAAVPGGFMIWTQDNTQINRIRAAQERANRALAEEKDLLAAENRLREEREAIAAQNRIYDGVSAAVRPQTEKIAALVRRAETDEKDRKQTMLQACLLTVYVKRTANLTLLAAENGALPAGELLLAVSESLSYLSRCGVPTALTGQADVRIEPQTALAAYAAFEALLEAVFDGLNGVTAAAAGDGGDLTLRLALETPLPLPEITPEGFELTQFTEDDVHYVTLRLPGKGAAV